MYGSPTVTRNYQINDNRFKDHLQNLWKHTTVYERFAVDFLLPVSTTEVCYCWDLNSRLSPYKAFVIISSSQPYGEIIKYTIKNPTGIHEKKCFNSKQFDYILLLIMETRLLENLI